MALDRTVWRLRPDAVGAANPLDVVMDGIVPLVGVASIDEVNTDSVTGSEPGPVSYDDDDDGMGISNVARPANTKNSRSCRCRIVCIISVQSVDSHLKNVAFQRHHHQTVLEQKNVFTDSTFLQHALMTKLLESNVCQMRIDGLYRYNAGNSTSA